jgi:hypothetical protein
VFAAKVLQEITHEKTPAHAEDDPADLLWVMDRWLPLAEKS